MALRTYGEIKYNGTARGWMIIRLEPQVCIRLKHVFQSIPTGGTVPFLLPDTLTTAADLAWFISRYPLRMTEGDRGRLENRQAAFWDEQREMEQILSPDYKPRGEWSLRPDQELRSYQARTVTLLRKKMGGLICGDDLGLGKTFTGLGAAAHPDALPALVVVEPHLQTQWARRAMAFAGLNSHIIKKASPYHLPAVDLFIITYYKLAGWVDVFADHPPGLVIFEEVQNLRTGDTTGKGLAARNIAAVARYALGLSATPVYNYGVEAYNILDIMQPDCLGRREDFEREWVTGDKGQVGDPKALGSFLREAHLMIRHTRKEVGRELPPVNTILETVDHDSEALDSVEVLARMLATTTLHGSFSESGEAARQLDGLLRQATGLAKAPYVARYVRMFVEAGEPVLLAGWHRAVYDIWLRELDDLNPVLYTGSEAPSRKDANVREFMAGRSQVLIMSLRSGTGLDVLQERCATVVFGELDWSPKVHDQIVGRLNRDGQTQPVMATYLTSEVGSDPPMIQVLGVKAHQAQGINDPQLAIQTVHSDRSRIKSLARSYLAQKKGRRRAA